MTHLFDTFTITISLLLGFILGIMIIQISTPTELEILRGNKDKILCPRFDNEFCYKVTQIRLKRD